MEYRPDSEDGFSALEREAYLARADRETARALHLAECESIVEQRLAHGFTLDERDMLSDYLTIGFPLPLPTDSELADRLALALKLDNRFPAIPRNLHRSELRHDADDANETLADDAQGEN